MFFYADEKLTLVYTEIIINAEKLLRCNLSVSAATVEAAAVAFAGVNELGIEQECQVHSLPQRDSHRQG